VLSIALAVLVAIAGRLTACVGAFIRTAAYNVQAYPIVAVAPIIFILLGDGLLSRLLIAAMICYFPLLLSFIGVFSEPVREIEHFYDATGARPAPQVKIRPLKTSTSTTVIVGSATMAMSAPSWRSSSPRQPASATASASRSTRATWPRSWSRCFDQRRHSSSGESPGARQCASARLKRAE
jgi:hypothetical protein